VEDARFGAGLYDSTSACAPMTSTARRTVPRDRRPSSAGYAGDETRLVDFYQARGTGIPQENAAKSSSTAFTDERANGVMRPAKRAARGSS
jgi:hypothetical protein